MSSIIVTNNSLVKAGLYSSISLGIKLVLRLTKMASSSGTTSIQNSSSEDYTQQMIMIGERKRKRMESNRESARRSRMRKQKHLDDLMAQIARLSNDNDHIMSEISVRTQQYLNVEAENSVLRAQMAELNQRFESLEEILGFVNAINGNEFVGDDDIGFEDQSWNMNMNMNMNMVSVNQPIMASAVDVFECW